MTLRKLLWSLWPHKHKYGRGHAATGIKRCKHCGVGAIVKRRVRKAA